MGGSAQPSVEHAAVRERLDDVYDPELDRSIVDLEYVDDVEVDEDRVAVTFTLPTAWCSPAFAWMMAVDARDEVGALPGVASVSVALRNHMHGEEITRGVNEGAAFEAVFPDAESGVGAVRRKLDRKARLARQYEAVEALRDAGLGPAQVATLTRADVSLGEETATVPVGDGGAYVSFPAGPLRRYLEKARTVGVVERDDDRLFADRDGEPVDPADFESVHRDARLARSNVSGQGGICSALQEARAARDE